MTSKAVMVMASKDSYCCCWSAGMSLTGSCKSVKFTLCLFSMESFKSNNRFNSLQTNIILNIRVLTVLSSNRHTLTGCESVVLSLISNVQNNRTTVSDGTLSILGTQLRVLYHIETPLLHIDGVRPPPLVVACGYFSKTLWLARRRPQLAYKTAAPMWKRWSFDLH